MRAAASARRDAPILVGDLNVAPHEHDVWSHKQLLKVVSHTPIEIEKLPRCSGHGDWIDVARERIRRAGEALHVVELPRAGLDGGQPRPPARPHLGLAARCATASRDFEIARDARGWQRPSDHVPVTVTLEA